MAERFWIFYQNFLIKSNVADGQIDKQICQQNNAIVKKEKQKVDLYMKRYVMSA